ncbi:xanthine dehydrogenase molybdopterin binding subunit [Bradymonas sediminis]|uniref:Xanthine dehydrogenase n=1 Tax=Bradymonas sediminis TaxID=1548548 RepID=A0A2Z4FGL8_9DELT|nr:molybdopterin cofactor-binding domain-containing protein [Bradymonas sediminis]AWV88040.1 xanthine dehydrogenase [Bradymonas sediminis]TDP77163.1 xanthine dehydrogenase large subunit [Bradymonas sediminis]
MKKHLDAAFHTRGESLYVDDNPEPAGMLHVAVFGSPVAHGTIKNLDLSAARALKGVTAVFTAEDIPGENQVGAILKDEVLIAEDLVQFIGQPIAVVVAETPEIAHHAVGLIDVEIDELPVIVDPRVAHEKGQLIAPPRTFAIGDVDAAWDDCDLIVEGECEIAGQEHLYLETQRSRAIPTEGDQVRCYSSTQSPYAVQTACARICGVPQHKIEVDVKRLGGGFGGKEDQATHWACIVTMAARILRKPVQIVLNRIDDMQMTGKRHPYSADFKLGLNKDGTIKALDFKFYQNSGAAADLSTAVLERSLFHATNIYRVPNARIYAAACKTNLHPHTAFRGFGGPQAMFVMESALSKAAETMGIEREELQYKNLISNGDVFPYGQVVEDCQAKACWDDAADTFDLAGTRKRIEEYNATHTSTKKGLAVMPICFGISFTKIHLNQASALVHIYTDGSMSVSTGGVEMGQGVTTNMAEIAAAELGISRDRIKVESTNTTRIANMSPSAASATTDLNGNAVILATGEILGRFRKMLAPELGCNEEAITIKDEKVFVDGEATEWEWGDVVMHAYLNRVALSAHAFFATPRINFDAAKEKGHPFAYHVYGVTQFEVTVDCLRGRYEVDAVRMVHDLGRQINEVVDLGQLEGGLAQGIGWMTLEELAYDAKGRLLSNALSTYKAPDVFSSPKVVEVKMRSTENPMGPRGSKAVGEPPLMYGIGAYFALRDAMRAYAERDFPYDAPMTPERVLMSLHAHILDGDKPKKATPEAGAVAAVAGE